MDIGNYKTEDTDMPP